MVFVVHSGSAETAQMELAASGALAPTGGWPFLCHAGYTVAISPLPY
jgi:hypothetical protein